MQRFIVGTGRCGSTLLSTLMAYHPEALVLSEFFGGLDVVNAFSEGSLSGDEFAAILLQDHEISNLNRSRAHVDREILLKVDQYNTPRIPAIMLACLPALTNDPEGLMREVVSFARSQKPAPLSAHYPALFDWLAAKFNKKFWIERSGASSEFFPGLRRVFPQARYLHQTRDGIDAAMSMYNMAHFITHISFWHNPPTDKEISIAIKREELPDNDLISRRRSDKPHPAVFGHFWTLSVCLLMKEIQHLKPDQYGEFSFDDMHSAPSTFLKDVCSFFEISSDDAWINRAVAVIRTERHNRFSELPAADQASLKAAVFPGNVLIGRESRERPNIDTYRTIRRIWDEIDPVKAVSF